MARIKLRTSWILGFSFWVGAFLLALRIGVVRDASLELITLVRLPRTVLASVLGMGLAVSGAALQALFSNPLCEPYLLGISSGSALGAVLGISLGLQWTVVGLTGTAFAGAILFAGILYLVSLRAGAKNLTLLLTGVMLGFFGNSLVALWMTFSDSNGLQGALIWLFGDLSRARLRGVAITAVGVCSLVFLIWTQSRELDALLMGEEGASSLGIDVMQVRRRIVLLTSILIGLCVSAGGMIGFVGLVVPHFARRFVGSLHSVLIPFCAIWGAVFLTLSDSLSRVLVPPYELPIGVVSALIGAPLFFWIMLTRREFL